MKPEELRKLAVLLAKCVSQEAMDFIEELDDGKVFLVMKMAFAAAVMNPVRDKELRDAMVTLFTLNTITS